MPLPLSHIATSLTPSWSTDFLCHVVFWLIPTIWYTSLSPDEFISFTVREILVLPPLPLSACPMHGPDQLTQVTDHNLSTFEELNLFQLLVVSTETGNVSFVQSGNSVQQHREQWGNLRILHTSEKDHIDSPLPTLVHSCAHSTHNPKLYFYNVKLEALKSFKLINA